MFFRTKSLRLLCSLVVITAAQELNRVSYGDDFGIVSYKNFGDQLKVVGARIGWRVYLPA
jgi:hypothetical protein